MKKGWVLALCALLLLLGVRGAAAAGERGKNFAEELPFGSGLEACGQWVRQRLEDALPEPVTIDGWQVSALPACRNDAFGIPMRYRFVFSGGKLAQFVAEHEEDAAGAREVGCYLQALAAVENACGAPVDGRILARDGAGAARGNYDYPLRGGVRDPEALRAAAADAGDAGECVWIVEYFEDRMVALVIGRADAEGLAREKCGVYVFIQPNLTDEMGKNRPFAGLDGGYRAAPRESE